MKNNIWWAVALKGGFVGQLFTSKRSARLAWSDLGGTTFHKVKIVPVESLGRTLKKVKKELAEQKAQSKWANADRAYQNFLDKKAK